MTSERENVGKRRRLPDVDSAEVGFRLKAFGWSLLAVLPGAAIGFALGSTTDSPFRYVLLGGVGGLLFAWGGSLFIADRAGRIGSALYFSSGRSTPARREYSHAESLIVRGRFDEAASELEQASARFPDDAAPPLRLARLLRDQCGRPVDAIPWFRTAVERSSSDPGAEIAALREMIEVYTHVLRMPERALPHLARLAERHPDSPAGAWARREIASIKASMRADP